MYDPPNARSDDNEISNNTDIKVECFSATMNTSNRTKRNTQKQSREKHREIKFKKMNVYGTHTRAHSLTHTYSFARSLATYTT